LRDIDLFEVSLVTTRCSMTRGSTWSPERGQPSRFSRFSSSRQFWGGFCQKGKCLMEHENLNAGLDASFDIVARQEAADAALNALRSEIEK
jgi:hypothetical protein